MTANGSLTDEGGIVNEVQGEPSGYEGKQDYSEYAGGSRRRKRGKRNSKKNSRRRSKKYMKKMYRGGEGEGGAEEEETVSQDTSDSGSENKDPEPGVVEPSVGGRRKSRKMRKGKMNKSKKMRKGKVSKWITHVKNFARSNKMDFRDALKDPKCKASYHKMK
jgi:hypothetical protein